MPFRFTTHTMDTRLPLDGQEEFNTLMELLIPVQYGMSRDVMIWLELMLMDNWV